MKKIFRVMVVVMIFLFITALLTYGMAYGMVTLGEEKFELSFMGIVSIILLVPCLYMLYDSIKMLKYQKWIRKMEKEGKLVRVSREDENL